MYKTVRAICSDGKGENAALTAFLILGSNLLYSYHYLMDQPRQCA
jgi:hypothetical protein